MSISNIIAKINTVFRDHIRYSGDGLPNSPVGHPVPVGDPSSGTLHLFKHDFRSILTDVVNYVFSLTSSVENVVASYQPLPNPFYLLVAGQSNAMGSAGETSGWWPSDGRLEVKVGSAWVKASTMQSVEPFHADGSLSPALALAAHIARVHGVTVRMVFSVQGSTASNQWLGTPSNRTISAANRPLWLPIRDAVESGMVPGYHGLFWSQGEGDWDQTDDYYLAQLAYLCDAAEGLGSIARVRPMLIAMAEPYHGVLAGQQARRVATIQKFARMQSGRVGLAATGDLEGRDDGIGMINHFTNASYRTIGTRAAEAMLATHFGTFNASDQRVNTLETPAEGIHPAALGHRWQQRDAITDATVSLSRAHLNATIGQVGGTCTITLPTANPALGDNGIHARFFQINAADVTMLAGGGLNIMDTRTGVIAPTAVVSGAASYLVRLEGSRWILTVDPRRVSQTTGGVHTWTTAVVGGLAVISGRVQHTGTVGQDRTITLPSTISAAGGSSYTATATGGEIRSKTATTFVLRRTADNTDLANGGFIDVQIFASLS